MTLQAHLETCETCSTYHEKLVRLENLLRRSLHAGWEGIPFPDADADTERDVILTIQQVRPRNRRHLLVASAATVLILIMILLGGPAGIRARISTRINSVDTGSPASAGRLDPGQAAPAEPLAAGLQPTVEPGQFLDVVAYEGRRDGLPNGDREIYLLNPGSVAFNLTDNRAQDTDPAWSPDGEWLAFLSDRAQKTEVYVTNLTASRVVQLTNEPGITWQGPLSWSPDGKWIALAGARDQQGSQNWIYLAALDGSGVRSLAGSRNGDSPEFSPSGDRVAFHFTDIDNEGIIVQERETGSQVTIQWMENPLVPSLAPGSAFDWSPDG